MLCGALYPILGAVFCFELCVALCCAVLACLRCAVWRGAALCCAVLLVLPRASHANSVDLQRHCACWTFRNFTDVDRCNLA